MFHDSFCQCHIPVIVGTFKSLGLHFDAHFDPHNNLRTNIEICKDTLITGMAQARDEDQNKLISNPCVKTARNAIGVFAD